MKDYRRSWGITFLAQNQLKKGNVHTGPEKQRVALQQATADVLEERSFIGLQGITGLRLLVPCRAVGRARIDINLR